MRHLVLPLLLAVAAPLSAQPIVGDSTGLSIGIDGSYHQATHTGTLGVRADYVQSNGLDYGIGLYGATAFSSRASSYDSNGLGASLGYSRALTETLGVRLESSLGYTSAQYSYDDADGNRQQYNPSSLLFDANATVSRRIPVLGSFQLHPTLGAYAGYRAGLDDRLVVLDGLDQYETGLDAGLQFGVPVSFRLFGTDVTVPLTTRFSATSGDLVDLPRWSPSSGLRVRF